MMFTKCFCLNTVMRLILTDPKKYVVFLANCLNRHENNFLKELKDNQSLPGFTTFNGLNTPSLMRLWPVIDELRVYQTCEKNSSSFLDLLSMLDLLLALHNIHHCAKGILVLLGNRKSSTFGESSLQSIPIPIPLTI